MLIDRPQSPQSVIIAGQITPVDPRSDLTALSSANEVIGGGFLARINMDLRETKGWSYGVRGGLAVTEQLVPYLDQRAGPGRPHRQFDRRAGQAISRLPELARRHRRRGCADRRQQHPAAARPVRDVGRSALRRCRCNDMLGRPDNYYELLADRYRRQTRASLDQAARAAIAPEGFVWVVVGDAAKIRPQLKKLGMPIEEIQPR